MGGFEVFLSVCAIFGSLGFILSIYNFIENRATAKATHTVQYVDVPYPGTQVDADGFEELTDETKKALAFNDDDPDFGLN